MGNILIQNKTITGKELLDYMKNTPKYDEFEFMYTYETTTNQFLGGTAGKWFFDSYPEANTENICSKIVFSSVDEAAEYLFVFSEIYYLLDQANDAICKVIRNAQFGVNPAYSILSYNSILSYIGKFESYGLTITLLINGVGKELYLWAYPDVIYNYVRSEGSNINLLEVPIDVLFSDRTGKAITKTVTFGNLPNDVLQFVRQTLGV